MGGDPDRNELIRSAAPWGAHVTCAPLFFSGHWDAIVLPTEQFFSIPEVRRTAGASVVPYGPAHLLRAAWLAGALDYLKEPWTAEELFLRVRGPQPPVLAWTTAGVDLVLEGSTLASDTSGVHLSPAEAGVLRLLVLRRGLAVSRAVLAWEAGCSPHRVIDTLVGRLRTKLRRLAPLAAGPEPVRGVGYRLP